MHRTDSPRLLTAGGIDDDDPRHTPSPGSDQPPRIGAAERVGAEDPVKLLDLAGHKISKLLAESTPDFPIRHTNLTISFSLTRESVSAFYGEPAHNQRVGAAAGKLRGVRQHAAGGRAPEHHPPKQRVGHHQPDSGEDVEVC